MLTVAPYVPQLADKPHDLMAMGLILLTFATFAAIGIVRHWLWRRQVMSAFR